MGSLPEAVPKMKRDLQKGRNRAITEPSRYRCAVVAGMGFGIFRPQLDPFANVDCFVQSTVYLAVAGSFHDPPSAVL